MRREYWTEKGAISRWQLLVAYVLIVGAFAVSAAGLKQDNEATQAVITRECRQTNARNTVTKKVLIEKAALDIEKAKANAKARHENPELFKNEIEGRRDVTLALIDGLVPKRDCANLVP